MIISAHLRSSIINFKRVALVGSSFFVFGCQRHLIANNKQVSTIDTLYIQQSRISENTNTISVQLYRNVLSKTLFSDCKWFPSDSAYTQRAQNKCGPLKGALMGIARFMVESDAAQMGYPLVLVDHKIHFKDFPNECIF